MTGRKAGDVAEGGAGEVGAPVLKEEIADVVVIEFGGHFGGHADDIEGVAEDELAGYVGVEEGARADEIAEAEKTPCGGIPEGEGVVTYVIGEGFSPHF